MRKPQTEQIDGNYYRVTPLGARQGAKLAKRLAKVLAPLSAQAGVTTAQLDASAIARVADDLDDADLDFVLDALAGATELSGDSAKWTSLSGCWDLHFAGEYGTLLRWAGFALRVNFPDFFSASALSTTAPGA